jgi:hypothetical protein
MSVHASHWVWEHSRSKGTARLVLLALADHAGADGGDAYPSVGRLAIRCGVGKRTVQEALKVLVSLGELVIEPQAGPGGANRYQIAMTPAESAPVRNLHPADPAPTPRDIRTPPMQIAQGTPADVAPEPSLTVSEPSGNRPSRAKQHAEFEEWWKHYPRKKAKGAARDAFAKARKKVSLETLIAGADAYANDPAREPDYTKHPATWLNSECWEDQADQERRRSKSTAAALRLLERHGGDMKELNA